MADSRRHEENSPSGGSESSPGSPVVIAYGVVALAAMLVGLIIGLLV